MSTIAEADTDIMLVISGRICMPVPQLNATCCVPCPYSNYMYADGFEARTEVASWVNVAAMFATLFVLISYAVLPVKWTSRHYLSVCLALGVFFIEVRIYRLTKVVLLTGTACVLSTFSSPA